MDDYIKLEIDQKYQCDTCKHISKGQDLKHHKNVRAYFVFDVNYDGRNKSTLADDGNLTDVLVSSVYSGIASLRGIMLVFSLSDLNGLEP